MKSLRFKIAFAVLVVLTTVMGSLFTFQYSHMKKEMIDTLGLSSGPLSDVIKRSLKHSMQTRNMDEVVNIIRNIRQQNEVEKIFVVNKKGVIKISGNEREIGRIVSIDSPTCQVCHRQKPKNRQKTVVIADNGGKTFRNVNPILNEKKCEKCHGVSDKILGVLITDFSMDYVEAELSNRLKNMIFSLFATVLIMAVTIFLILNRLVIKKLEKLSRATKRVSNGLLEQKVCIETGDEIGMLAVIFNEMVENLKKAREIRERKDLLENVLNCVSESILLMDDSGSVMMAGKCFYQIFRYREGEILGREYQSICEERNRIFGMIRENGPLIREITLKDREGNDIPVFLHLFELRNEEDETSGYVEIARDLRGDKEREKLREKFVEQSKFASLGKLAAGVAHEINNPMASVVTCAEGLLDRLKSSEIKAEEFEEYLTIIKESAFRCKNITEELLDFAKPREPALKLASVNELIRDVVQLLDHRARLEDKIFRLHLGEAPVEILCDPSQLNQVFMNILMNAFEAVSPHGGVDISADEDDEKIRLRFQDDGRGIKREDIPKIFDPFFTTKPAGSGTGLGLAVCRSIIEKHGGTIEARSEGAGRGAEFIITLKRG